MIKINLLNDRLNLRGEGVKPLRRRSYAKWLFNTLASKVRFGLQGDSPSILQTRSLPAVSRVEGVNSSEGGVK